MKRVGKKRAYIKILNRKRKFPMESTVLYLHAATLDGKKHAIRKISILF